MKFRTTRKAIVSGTSPDSLFQCGYCDMQSLLTNHSPIAYTCGVYGWNFDVYSVNGLTITTGYRNTCGKRIDWDILRSYEKRASAVLYDYSVPYESRKESVEKLLSEFCEILKKGE